MYERLGLEKRDNLLPADLYPVHLYNEFSCTVWMFTDVASYKCMSFLVSKQTETGNVADIQRKMISNRI